MAFRRRRPCGRCSGTGRTGPPGRQVDCPFCDGKGYHLVPQGLPPRPVRRPRRRDR